MIYTLTHFDRFLQVNPVTFQGSAQPTELLARPIPPADDPAPAVRALNAVLGQLGGKMGLAALGAGDSCASLTVDLFAPAWEGARQLREQFILTLARSTRDEWKRDLNELPHNAAEEPRLAALRARLQITLDFCFRFLTRRHASLLSDALFLAFEPEMAPPDFAAHLLDCATASNHSTAELRSAIVGAPDYRCSVPDDLDAVLQQLAGQEALAALRAGDSCAKLDMGAVYMTWESRRLARSAFILALARHARSQWRSDVVDISANQPSFLRPTKIANALEERLRICLDFAFQLLNPVQVCLLGDALMLSFEADMAPSEFALELAGAASRSPKAQQRLLESLVLGASGMHRYQPERVIAAAHADRQL